MKIVTIAKDRHSYSNDYGMMYYYCPNCELDHVTRGDNYCPNCGSKIKWSLK